MATYGGYNSPLSYGLQQYDPNDPTGGFNQWNPNTYGGGQQPGTGLGSTGFFIPSGFGAGGQQAYGGSTVPMGGGGGVTGVNPQTGAPTGYGTGTAGQFQGQDPRYMQAYSAPEALRQAGRTAAQGMMSQYALDKPETFIRPLLKQAAVENVQTMKDWENMARDIESRYAGGGASLSSERNRALEEGRGATAMAVRGARTKAETTGMQQWANVMAQLLNIMGR